MFILTVLLLTTILIPIFMDLNSLSPDETNYIFVGKSILIGEYPDDFTHRLPFIPSIISLSILSGIGINGARILIPIIFMNLLLLVTYFYVRKIYGKKEAFLSTIFIFTFPFFWRWGLSVLTDIPLAVFSALFIFNFYLGVERDKKYFLFSALSLSLGMLLKFNIIIFLIPLLIYVLYRKKPRIFISKEFIISAALVPIIFVLAYLFFSIFSGANILVTRQLTFFISPWNISELTKFVFVPTLLFSILGMLFVRNEKKGVFFLICLLMYTGFFIWSGHLRLRYLSLLIPIFAIFASKGFVAAQSKLDKRLVYGIFSVLVLASFMNTVYLIDLEEKSLWGTEELSKYINSIEGDITIATEYLPYYLKSTTTKNILSVPRYTEFNGKKMEFDKFMNILINISHPDYLEYFNIRKSGNYTIYKLFDYNWFKNNGVDYVVISIYYDYEESGVTAYFHPKFGPFEIPFVKRPYCNGRIPPDYTFRSEPYNEIENDSRFKKAKEIYRDEQRIFIIYEVSQ